MTAKRVTPRTLDAVMARFLAYVVGERDASARQAYCDSLNTFLDDLLSEDAFGTEGQLDPRGDHRE